MKNLTLALFSALAIGSWSQAATAQSYSLTLMSAGAPSNVPAEGTGGFSIDTPPPGTNPFSFPGLYTEATPGNDLLGMSFVFGSDVFDLTTENVPGTASVQFDASDDLSSIDYFGSLADGDTLSITGLSYDLFNESGTVNSIGDILVPEPASMTVLAMGLAGLAALRRRRPL